MGLEKKLKDLSKEEPKPAEITPPPPQPAETTPPPPPPPPKPKEEAPPVLVYEQWKSVGTKNWNDQKAVLTGYTAPSDRYFASLHVRDAPDVPSANWNDQKKVLTGYTQPGNKYFATRQRLAYHPRDKTFLTPGTGTSTSSTQKAPPPPK